MIKLKYLFQEHSTQLFCCVVKSFIFAYMIPEFNDDGYLPAGIYQASWQEVVGRYGISEHRKRLLNGFRAAIEILAYVGCKTVYLDGSFVTNKLVPGDFDACWEIESVDVELLMEVEPVLLEFSNGRIAQKIKFKGELFPASVKAEDDPPFRTFLEFFQTDKNTGNSKGIIAIDLNTLP